jgi:multidrug efflux pump subunit AcrB
LSATFLTLIVVPVVYAVLARKEELETGKQE